MTRYSGNIVRAALPGASTISASGNWELEDAVQQIGSGQWPAAAGLNDPNFFRNALLLTGDGTNGAQNNTFLDSSTNNFTITRNGNATQGSFTPYGGANYSAFFDGNGDYVALGGSSLVVGTADFTVELWLFVSSYGSSNMQIIETRTAQTGDTANWAIYLENVSGTGSKQLRFFAGNADRAATSSAFPLNTWQHVAVSRASGVTRFFVNGVQVGSNYTDANNYSSTGWWVGVYPWPSATAYLNGYLSNVRLTRTGLYNANFTPSAAPLNALSSTMLLMFASERFESLAGGASTAISRYGDTKITEFNPFNSYNRTPVSYGVALNGTTDFLTTATAPNLTGDFTIEAWVFQTAQSTFEMICGSGPNYWAIGSTNNFEVAIGSTPAYPQFTSGSAFPLNQWVHVALCRSGTSLRAFINGTQVGATATNSNAFFPTGTFYIGQQGQANNYWYHGNISNFRIVKGTALYTANFTPSTTPLTAVANTFLLACQDTTFKDNSANAAVITVNGSPRPVKANPFGYTIALGTGYSPATMGGSAYFDGNGDFLTLASSANLGFGAGDFTVEFWAFPTVNARQDWLDFTDGTNRVLIYYTGTNIVYYVLPTTAAAITGSAPVFNQWNHIAVCRSGTSTRLFLNGIQQGSTFTDSKNYGAVSLTVGKDNAGSTHVTGNMSNIRIVKGTALYTGPFVPPQAPLTAVTNTQLLMNFSNGAIFDYATGAVLETVGDTKLNTTIKKYGTASIAFDGAGDSLDFVPNPVGSFSQRGSWTIEMWVYPTNLSVAQYFYSQNTSNFLQLVISSTGFLQVDRSGVGTAITSSSALTINTWQHVALVSDGTNLKLYVNGTQTGNTIAVGTQVDPSSSIIRIGAYQNSGGAPTLPFYGYLDDIRISRYARYTANFTPPTSALPVF